MIDRRRLNASLLDQSLITCPSEYVDRPLSGDGRLQQRIQKIGIASIRRDDEVDSARIERRINQSLDTASPISCPRPHRADRLDRGNENPRFD